MRVQENRLGQPRSIQSPMAVPMRVGMATDQPTTPDHAKAEPDRFVLVRLSFDAPQLLGPNLAREVLRLFLAPFPRGQFLFTHGAAP